MAQRRYWSDHIPTKPVQMEFVGVRDGKVSFRQNGALFHVKPKPLTESPKTAQHSPEPR